MLLKTTATGIKTTAIGERDRSQENKMYNYIWKCAYTNLKRHKGIHH